MKERCDGLSSVSVICDAFFLTSVGSVKVTGPDISSVLFSLLFVCKAEKMLRKQFNEFQVREYDSHQPLPGKWYQGPILGTSAASLTGACARTFKPETWRFHHFFFLQTSIFFGRFLTFSKVVMQQQPVALQSEARSVDC